MPFPTLKVKAFKRKDWVWILCIAVKGTVEMAVKWKYAMHF